MKDKNNAYADYMEMIRSSWTYGKLTPAEVNQLENLMSQLNDYNRITGSYNTRWDQLECIYEAYLTGAGYDGPFWRSRWEA